jgi:hypothetical protein
MIAQKSKKKVENVETNPRVISKGVTTLSNDVFI